MKNDPTLTHSPPLERRQEGNRRTPTLASVLFTSLRGRRRYARRRSDQLGYYIDRYEPRFLYLALGILLLSGTDAILTLNLLQQGAVEVNVLMAWLITTDVQLFANTKMAVTGIGLILLVAHIRFRLCWVKVSHILYLILSLYMLLIVYELALLAGMATAIGP